MRIMSSWNYFQSIQEIHKFIYCYIMTSYHNHFYFTFSFNCIRHIFKNIFKKSIKHICCFFIPTSICIKLAYTKLIHFISSFFSTFPYFIICLIIICIFKISRKYWIAKDSNIWRILKSIAFFNYRKYIINIR